MCDIPYAEKISLMQITTISINAQFKCCIHLKVLYEFIELNSFLIGKKFEDQTYGDVKESRAFSNQVTLNYRFGKQRTSIKIFANGQAQLAGGKDIEKCRDLLWGLYLMIEKIKGYFYCTVTMKHNVLYYMGFS